MYTWLFFKNKTKQKDTSLKKSISKTISSTLGNIFPREFSTILKHLMTF